MRGLSFEQAAPAPESAPERADVACFAGFVARRPTPLPSATDAWLTGRGWLRPPAERAGDAPPALLDVPVPVDSWSAFDHLFAWERRPLIAGSPTPSAESYLGAAVRSFFAQGGRRCYVIRSGDPWALGASREDRLFAVRQLVPGLSAQPMSPLDRARWRGLAHLHELADVSFVALPDLPDACAQSAPPLAPAEPAAPAAPEVFVDCSAPEPPAPPGTARVAFAAPRCEDELGYADWKEIVRMSALFLSRHRRDVQLVAAIPLPGPGAAVAADPLAALLREGWMTGLDEGGIASAFVQLVYPWLETAGSGGLPEGLEPPEGAVLGALARSVLLQGAFRSAARQPLLGVRAFTPRLSAAQRERRAPWRSPGAAPARSLEERVTLVGETVAGVALLSDVTASGQEAWRPACVSRLVGLLLRACRRAGEDAVFEASNERTWAALRDRIRGLLLSLWQLGALRGSTPAEALQVDCDRSTMSQQDLDEGRLVVRVQMQPAAPVERIAVVLALQDGGVTATAAGGGAS
ncbi:phage tail sheath C-terminal domain-containing protein [Sorangium sp. So ce1024]|uniref:phage tail sheath C-terminal domain-containing protein n=1 Tax=unclassified Sorangium TaxID=2621164 RepID=UPI003EFEB835